MTVTLSPADWATRCATELHPHWCVATTATGCGDHLSTIKTHPATADPEVTNGGWVPHALVAAWMGPNGEQGVQVAVYDRNGEAEAVFTAQEWLAIRKAGDEALALIAADPRMGTRPTEDGVR